MSHCTPSDTVVMVPQAISALRQLSRPLSRWLSMVCLFYIIATYSSIYLKGVRIMASPSLSNWGLPALPKICWTSKTPTSLYAPAEES